MNRKEFLLQSSLYSIGLLSRPSTYWNDHLLQEGNISVFDMHCHPGIFFMKDQEGYPGDEAFINRKRDMQTAFVAGAFFSLVADWPLLTLTDKGVVTSGQFGPDEGWNEYRRQLQYLTALLEKVKLKIETDINDRSPKTPPKVWISCEGGDFLGGNVDRIDEAYEDGVRSIQLVHYAQNDLGDLQTWKEQYGGLSSFGKQVVKKMNETGMVIDVAHASAKTVKDVVNLTTDPIILSHSILKKENQGPMSARAISEGHALLVAETGGVIGMWPSGASKDLEEFVDETMRMIDVVGIDHVGIGTDMDANFKPVIKDYSDVSKWQQGLLNRGLSRPEVQKVSEGNMLRLLREVL